MTKKTKNGNFQMKNSDIFSSPELLGLLAELIVYPSSWRPLLSSTTIFKDLKAVWHIKAKFHLEPPCEGGKQNCISGPGHITKMATKSTYGSSQKPFCQSKQNFMWSLKAGKGQRIIVFSFQPG